MLKNGHNVFRPNLSTNLPKWDKLLHSGATGLTFGLTLYRVPFFVRTSKIGSGEVSLLKHNNEDSGQILIIFSNYMAFNACLTDDITDMRYKHYCIFL